MMLLSRFEPLFDQLDILFGCRYAAFRLLLKDMEDVDGRFKPDSIDSTIGISIKIIDNFQYPSTFKTLQGLGVIMLLT
jgi:hypothetical protein